MVKRMLQRFQLSTAMATVKIDVQLFCSEDRASNPLTSVPFTLRTELYQILTHQMFGFWLHLIP